MDRLKSLIAFGAIFLIIGLILVSLSSYFSNAQYNFDQCYNLYPSTYINGTYTYSPAYYKCEANATVNENRYDLYSTLTSYPGFVLLIIGLLTVVGGIVVLLIASYKDRKNPPLNNKKGR